MRRNGLFRREIAALGALGAIAAAAGCGGASSSGGGSTAADASYLAAVTRAADATDRVPGYKYAITTTASFGGKSFTVEGAGTINERGSEGSMALEVEGHKLAEVIDGPYIYIEAPSGADTSATHGKRWVRADVATFAQSYGAGSLGGGSQDPTQVLSYLKSAGAVTRVGREAVRGVSATHYHAVIDLDRLASTGPAARRAAAKGAAELLERATGAKTMPMDVWVGDDGHVSRMAFALSLCTAEGRIHESFSMDLYDYGRQPVVAPPPASQVTDIDAQLKSQVAKSLSQLSCH